MSLRHSQTLLSLTTSNGPDSILCQQDLIDKIRSATDKIRSVSISLPAQKNNGELRYLFTPILVYLEMGQLEIDDHYFLRTFVRTTCIGLLLDELGYTNEATQLLSAADILRDAYVRQLLSMEVKLDENKLAVEFSNFDFPAQLINEKGLKRVYSKVAALLLSSRNYFLYGAAYIDRVMQPDFVSIDDYSHYIRSTYYNISRAKAFFGKFKKTNSNNFDSYWAKLIELFPGSYSPIAFDYSNMGNSPKSGLSGLNYFARDLAGLTLISIILATHPSACFEEVADAIYFKVLDLKDFYKLYCQRIGGSKLAEGAELAGASELQAKLDDYFEIYLIQRFKDVNSKYEFAPQCEKIAMILGLPSVAMAA